MADTPSKGTVIRGADGSLYYISEDKMQSFKLPDEHTAEARKMLDDAGMKAKAGLVPALHGDGLVKSGPTTEPGTYLPVTQKLKSIAAGAYLPAKNKSKSIAAATYLPSKTKSKSIAAATYLPSKTKTKSISRKKGS
jgi:hypothetical protein